MYTTYDYIYPSLLADQRRHADMSYLDERPLSYEVYDRALILPAVFSKDKASGFKMGGV